MLPPSASNTVAGRYNSASLEQEEVIFDRPCYFMGAVVGNYGGAGFYFWIEDRADNGLAASWPITPPVLVQPGEVRSIDWTLAPRSMGRGIYVCASTSPTVRTLPGTNDAFFEVAYAIT
jgi:hypothetical protein